MPGECSLIRGAMIGTYTLTSPGSLVLIVAQVLAALKLPERHSFCLELPPLALRREAGGRSRVESLDLVPPNVGINLHRDPCRAAARVGTSYPLPSEGRSPKYSSNSSGVSGREPCSTWSSPTVLVIAGSRATPPCLSETTSYFPPPRFRPGRQNLHVKLLGGEGHRDDGSRPTLWSWRPPLILRSAPISPTCPTACASCARHPGSR